MYVMLDCVPLDDWHQHLRLRRETPANFPHLTIHVLEVPADIAAPDAQIALYPPPYGIHTSTKLAYRRQCRRPIYVVRLHLRQWRGVLTDYAYRTPIHQLRRGLLDRQPLARPRVYLDCIPHYPPAATTYRHGNYHHCTSLSLHLLLGLLYAKILLFGLSTKF